jgi:two-component system LytT family response regulator
MIRVVLIDDEPLARQLVREYLSAVAEVQVVAECNDGYEGLKAIAAHSPDLVFLDVQMPKISGFEMLELLDTPPPVIFTTAFDEYALKAFEASAVDYLLKPFSKDRFMKAFDKWRQQGSTLRGAAAPQLSPPEEAQRIVVKKGQNIVIVPVAEVHYLEAYDDYVKIHTHEGFFLKKKTMGHYERVLPAQQFVRVHRSYLLNISQLTRIEPAAKDNHLALLKSGVRLPLSESGFARLRAALGM